MNEGFAMPFERSEELPTASIFFSLVLKTAGEYAAAKVREQDAQRDYDLNSD